MSYQRFFWTKMKQAISISLCVWLSNCLASLVLAQSVSTKAPNNSLSSSTHTKHVLLAQGTKICHHKDKSLGKNLQSGDSPTISTELNLAPCISWVSPFVTPRVALLCIHGLGLYSGSYNDFGLRMSRNGIATYAIDVRGFGSWLQFEGKHPMDFNGCLDDIKTSLASIRAANPGLPVFLLGESMGGAIALRFASIHPELIDGLISSTPAGDRFNQKRTDLKVAIALLTGPNKELNIGKAIVKQATQNEQLRKVWESDPLDRMKLSARELIHFQSFMNENHDCVKEIKTLPVLMVQGTEDHLVKPNGTWELFNELSTIDKVFVALPSEHLIFEDSQTESPQDKIRNSRLVTAWIFTHTPLNTKISQQGNTAHLSTAISQLVTGKYTEARTQLEELSQDDPTSSELAYWLAIAYLKTNSPNLAKQEFVHSMSLGKGNEIAKEANNYLLSMSQTPNQLNAETSTSTPYESTATVTTQKQALNSPSLVSITQRKPTVLIFYADWCEQCANLDSLIQQGKELDGDKVNFIKIDVDNRENQNLVEQLKVGPIPTMIYLTKEGQRAFTLVGQSNFINFATPISAITQSIAR